MTERKRTDAGSRAVLVQLERRLSEVDDELAKTNELMAERRRLLAARAALTGERAPASPLVRRVTQDELAAYLVAHPGARAAQIARDMGVALTNISQHLHRGRETRFERREDGWHCR